MKSILKILPLIALLLTPAWTQAESNSSHLNKMRLMVGRALVEVTSDNWLQVLPYYSYDILYKDPVVTIEGIGMMSQFLARMFANSPDLITIVEDEICIDGVYTASWTMTGFFGEVPYTASGMSIIKFKETSAKVYYQRDYYSEGDIMANIPGLDQALEGFRMYYRCAVDPTYLCPPLPEE